MTIEISFRTNPATSDNFRRAATWQQAGVHVCWLQCWMGMDIRPDNQFIGLEEQKELCSRWLAIGAELAVGITTTHSWMKSETKALAKFRRM
jgi:hypothetical protein